MSNIQPYQEKRHRGLGRLLGKRDKTPERERPDLQTDSAYGSSEANSADGPAPARSEPPRSEPMRSDSDMVSAEKGSEIGDIDQNRNLALRPSTGEVFDEDTGEIVTVVTTTTTTTTTTTRKPGGKPQQDVQKDVRREVQPGPGPNSTGLQEMPAGTIGSEPQSQLQPAITSTSTTQRAPPPAPPSDRLSADMPPVPARSAMRKSQEIPRNVPGGLPGDDMPVSPVDATYPTGRTGMTPPGSPPRANYSYPSRSSNRMADQPVRQNQGTIGDLRAAAKGLHGVGETLRGTLNSTIDSRFPSRDAEKAARIEAHNAAVLEKGRAEMEGIPGGWPAREHGNGAPAHDITTGAPATTGATAPTAPTTSANQPQRNISPGESGKPRSLGKLFKRKPVAAGEQGMETR
ncbi:hypothetical protein LTR10_014563 [Elasticomyces elasticus]|uniref:Uncharacterized protein n=1 Tax=Exophiala sideris TaxID=1016849 RepID=A0ABR0JSH3_9EURO|nr:hypothetical protein LTR10_014563 [Elasticomyces elasticus]KAK5040541.1 hypothetical protein LTS07_001039 [Exophiala sideris]KAK5043034.1 hypothetical protein LTR13_000805 [Exophiala sideris]KAK5068919.1 hypothetical protein LTR69_001040 [Exophiala sideris]KAK5186516.1 hypothetical protein LTR44_001572 [Eurotiomycetes sp. CCFEE 6388]